MINKDKNNRNSPLFILGCERSGSTWLSNIIDSHRYVEFFMEPFADYMDIFPGFPERNYYLDNAVNNYLLSFIKDKLVNLHRYKYLIYKRGGHPYLFNLENLVISYFRYVSKITKSRPPLRIERLTSLNLNQKGFHPFDKEKEISLIVYKELRLNFKVGVLSALFPMLKILITIRHPGAQISSIIRLMNKGHLGEMRKSLRTLPEFVREIKRFEKYRILFDNINWGQDIEYMLTVWWLINYEVLIEDCKKFNVDFRIVYHEEISKSPDTFSNDIFNFIGLDLTKEVKDYIKKSSTHNNNIKSPLDTERNSSEYYKMQMRNVNKSLSNKITKAFNKIEILDEIKYYKNYFL